MVSSHFVNGALFGLRTHIIYFPAPDGKGAGEVFRKKAALAAKMPIVRGHRSWQKPGEDAFGRVAKPRRGFALHHRTNAERGALLRVPPENDMAKTKMGCGISAAPPLRSCRAARPTCHANSLSGARFGRRAIRRQRAMGRRRAFCMSPRRRPSHRRRNRRR